MSYELFSRIPNCCGVWKKLKPVNTDRWLRTLLHAYLDEDTKHRPEEWGQAPEDAPKAERRALVSAGKAPLTPGADYTPFASGLWVFGHLANRLAEHGATPTFAQPQTVVERLGRWWVHDRQDAAIKAHHVTASFDPRIAEELHRRGYPVDAMLLASFHNTVSQFGARFYPGTTIGWVAGCHHDRAHPHVHALFHPETSDGVTIRMSGLKDGEIGDDRFEFFRTSFNTRARQLFVGLTQGRKVIPTQESLAARQFALLSRHALFQVDPQSKDATYKAAELVQEWLRSRDYGALLAEAAKAAEEDFRMSPPGVPDPARIRARWWEMRDGLNGKRTAHLTAATHAYHVLAEARNAPDGYRVVLDQFGAPSNMTESEYFAVASRHTKAPVGSLADAFEARRADSDRIREAANEALEAYRESIESRRKDMDALMVQAGFVAAQVELSATLSFGTKLEITQVHAEADTAIPRMLPSPDRIEVLGEREMAAITAKEADAHLPEDPAATPSLLATRHCPRFRELMTPSAQLPDRGPTIR